MQKLELTICNKRKIERNTTIGTNFNGGSNMRNDRRNDKDKVLMNERIRATEVRLIDDEGVNHGVIATSEALKMAYAKDLDLVIMNATQAPPVATFIKFASRIFKSSFLKVIK